MMHQFRCEACGATYFDQDKAGILYMHACPPLPAGKDGVEKERANKRDENIAPTRRGELGGIISAGDGVTCLTDARLEEPTWISRLYSQIEAQEAKADA